MSAPEFKSAKIFISYSKTTPNPTTAIAEFLTAQGHSVWWDKNIVAGEVFRDSIDRELDAADVVIVIWTPASIRSQWVIAEADHAAKARKLVTLRTEDVAPGEIPKPYNTYHVDLVENGQAILNAIHRTAGAQGPIQRASAQATTKLERSVQSVARGLTPILLAAIVVGGVLSGGGLWYVVHQRQSEPRQSDSVNVLRSVWQLEKERLELELRQARDLPPDRLKEVVVALGIILDKLDNPFAASKAYARTAEAAQEQLDKISVGVSSREIDKAKSDLAKGSPTVAKQIFAQNAARDAKNAAENFFQAGALSEQEARIVEADGYYARAVAIEPENETYVLALYATTFWLSRFDDASRLLVSLRQLKQSKGTLDAAAVRRNDLSLASVKLARGQLPEAETLYLAHRAAIEADGTPREKAVFASNLGSVYQNWGRYRDALPLLENALGLFIPLGAESVDVAYSLSNLAFLKTMMADYGTVERDLLEAQRILAQRYGPQHYRIIASTNNLGRYFIHQGRPEQAAATLKTALDIGEAAFAKKHPHSARTLDLIGELALSRQDHAVACRHFEESLALKRAMLGEATLEVAHTRTLMAGCLAGSAKYPEARDQLAMARRIVIDLLGEKALRTADIDVISGQVHLAAGERVEARACFSAAHATRQSQLGGLHPLSQEAVRLLRQVEDVVTDGPCR